MLESVSAILARNEIALREDVILDGSSESVVGELELCLRQVVVVRAVGLMGRHYGPIKRLFWRYFL